MKTTDLYRKMQEENIYYIKHKLSYTRAMIGHYKDITVIVVDDTKVKTKESENTVLIQELGHYMANAYYKANSQYEFIEKQELLADIKAWEEFFPYEQIKELMKKGFKTATDLARYFEVEASYMARCLNYYYELYGGF